MGYMLGGLYGDCCRGQVLPSLFARHQQVDSACMKHSFVISICANCARFDWFVVDPILGV